MLIVSMAILSMLTLPGRADTFGFRQVNGSNPELAPQFSLNVDAGAGAGTVDFLFHNNVPGYEQKGYCSVTDIYFYGADLIDPASCNLDQVGCNFTKSPTTPPNLPGWQGPPTALVYSTGIEGGPWRGLDDKSDTVKFTFALNDGNTFAQLLKDLHGGAFVAGLKVQSIWPCDNSATFVTTPVPAAALLGLLGMATAGMKLRKFV